MLIDIDRECPQLTSQERRVAELTIQGLRTKQVARKLDISPRTVEAYNQAIYRKVGVGNAVELVYRLYEQHFSGCDNG